MLTMKWANPLYYPVPVLVGAIALFLGGRVLGLPPWVVVPGSGAIAIVGAAIRKEQEPDVLEIDLDNPELERELENVREQARILVAKANELKTEATRILTDTLAIEALASVQYACDRTNELPEKIDRLIKRLHGSDSLLSVEELTKQLETVQAKQHQSHGTAQVQLAKLADSLRHNLTLAQAGKDAREAQVLSLAGLILDGAGVLQKLQNSIRTVDLTNAAQTNALQTLGQELITMQETVDLLISR